MLRGAAPGNGRAPRSTAMRVETVSAKDPGSSRAESEVRIRVSSLLPRRITFQLTRRLTFQLTHSPSQHTRLRTLRLSQPQPMNPPTLSASTNEPSDSLSLYPEDGVVIYRPPSAGRGLGEADVTVRPDWTGLPWVRPFWAGFRPYRETRPLHTCGLAKKELHKEDFAC